MELGRSLEDYRGTVTVHSHTSVALHTVGTTRGVLTDFHVGSNLVLQRRRLCTL